ncbi:MAG TPA: hypothetical protein GXZ23_05880 [Clostridiales bacterium]|nr:hypothetical protein [Clostridiales bacterium]
MDEITAGFCRFPFGFVLVLMFLIGLIGLLRKPVKKKAYIALMVIPLVLVYTMNFSGSDRIAPLTKKNIQEIIEIASAYDYSEEFFEGSAENGVIKYQGYFSKGSVSDIGRGTIFEELFSRKGTYNDMQYDITSVSSDKGNNWQIFWHIGYKGAVFIQLDEDHYLEFYYTITRKIDKYLGFFYAPPLLPIYSFTA